MYSGNKLKISTGLYYPIVIFLSYILAIFEILIRKLLISSDVFVKPVPFVTYFLVGLFFIYMGIYQWFKYRLWIYTVGGIIIGILCFQAPAMFSHTFSIFKAFYLITLIILIIFIIVNWRSFYSQERFEINSRRFFRLAASQIQEPAGGYTSRPFAAGKLTFAKEELLGFSRYLSGKFISRPFYHDDRIYFTFSMNRSLVGLHDPLEVSNIMVDFSGNISVSISEKDYREFVEEFTFDQLCQSMASVFERFLEYYKMGKDERIITEIKSA